MDRWIGPGAAIALAVVVGAWVWYLAFWAVSALFGL